MNVMGYTMKLICTSCGTVMDMGSRVCTNLDTRCPPEQLSPVLNGGDRLDEFVITSGPFLLRRSAFYQAERGTEKVWLKIAFRGYEDYLKREAALLSDPDHHEAMPRLVSATRQEQRAYGKIAIGETILYYLALEFMPGKLLSVMLREQHYLNPQQACQIVLGLADLVAFLHVRKGIVVYNLSPETVFVRLDSQGVPRSTLLDYATAAAPGQPASGWPAAEWSKDWLAPEVLAGRGDARSDVYGLAAISYTLLAGQSPGVARAAAGGSLIPLAQRRPELAQGITGLVDQGLQPDPAARPVDVRHFAKGLRLLIGDLPPEQQRFQLGSRTLVAVILIVTVILIIFIIWLLTQS